jgi:hypothetical protein
VEELIDIHVEDGHLVLSSVQKKRKLLEYALLVSETKVVEKEVIAKEYKGSIPKMYKIWWSLVRRNETRTPEHRASSNRAANLANKRRRMRTVLKKQAGRFNEVQIAQLVRIRCKHP